jgi:beta-fructofuranosidase
MKAGQDLTVQVFLDRSVVEVFANRQLCMTERLYPANVEAVTVELFSQAGSVTAGQVDVWPMKAIW